MIRILTLFGVSFTSIYLVALWWLTGGRLESLTTLQLNEVGDFLAGAFGPLAILWLVLGFFQQGMELRQSTEALQLQGQELKNSVEQQKRMAELSLEALKLEQSNRLDQEKRFRASLKPILTVESDSPTFLAGRYVLECRIINDGAQIFSLEFYLKYGGSDNFQAVYRTLERGQSAMVNVTWDPDSLEERLDLKINYTELDGTANSAIFTAMTGEDLGSIQFHKVGSFRETQVADG